CGCARSRDLGVLDVLEELGVPLDGRRAVDEEDYLLARLVARLQRRAWMDGDEPAGLDVDALRRFAEKHCQRPAQGHEDFLLVRIEVAAAARVRRVAPHACARLLEPRRVGDRRLAARGLAVQRLTLFPLQLGAAHDVVAHAATIPSRAMAR